MTFSRRVATPLVVVSLLLAGGCTEVLLSNARDGEDRFQIVIKTEHPQYQLRPSEDDPILVSLRNEGDAPVYLLLPSAYVTLEKKVGRKWQNLGRWYATLSVVPQPQDISPGDDPLWGPRLYTSDSIVEGPGVYRFRFELYADPGPPAGELLPLGARVSRPFEIVR